MIHTVNGSAYLLFEASQDNPSLYNARKLTRVTGGWKEDKRGAIIKLDKSLGNTAAAEKIDDVWVTLLTFPPKDYLVSGAPPLDDTSASAAVLSTSMDFVSQIDGTRVELSPTLINQLGSALGSAWDASTSRCPSTPAIPTKATSISARQILTITDHSPNSPSYTQQDLAFAEQCFHRILALKAEGSVTSKPTPRDLASPEWAEADEKGLLKVLGGDDPVVGRTPVKRKDLDFACNLVMARTITHDLQGNVVKRATRVAADGRNDSREVERAVCLPDLAIQRAVLLYSLSMGEVRISDVGGA